MRLKAILAISIIICFLQTILTKLICVVEINRSGARTSENFNTEPINSFYGSNKKITPNGFHQEQILGKYMREIYITTLRLIDFKYQPGEFEIYALPNQRSIFSAEGFILGLFPGSISHLTSEEYYPLRLKDSVPFSLNLPIDTIPLSIITSTNSTPLIVNDDCLYMGKTIKEELESSNENVTDIFEITFDDYNSSAYEVANELNIATTEVESDPKSFMEKVLNYIYVFCYHYNKSINDFTKETARTIKQMSINAHYKYKLSDSSALKHKSSELLKKIIELFDEAIEGEHVGFLKKKKYTKYTVYFGEEYTIIDLIANLVSFDTLKNLTISALDNKEEFDFLIPPFASTLQFELHSDMNNYYVRIIYNGKVVIYPLKNNTEETANLLKEGIPYKPFKLFVQNDRIDQNNTEIICNDMTLQPFNITYNKLFLMKAEELKLTQLLVPSMLK